ncbi:unnamed protein product [Didymodactylos carnosus]|uniref:Hedgehog protein Hint domain-containing protein n=1 Tax=Didymodactylos carnosus TaxID=1234261 RepID=A0A8S2X5J8_9BILA|nr:unnamed protein product [Didymodactylos carnosus]
MLDNEPHRFGFFKSLVTSNGHQLTLSLNHLIPTKQNGYLMAKDLTPGIEIYVANSENVLKVESISNITNVWKQGYAAPLTQSGTIIVNHVAASCYATINSHRLAHTILAPMRWWYSLSRYLSLSAKTDTHQTGIHWFPNVIFKITSYFLPSIIN